MPEPESTNLLCLAHLAAVMRPVFRCPTAPEPLRELHCQVVDALDGDGRLDATEAALRAVIMLRNATARHTAGCDLRHTDAGESAGASGAVEQIEAVHGDDHIGLDLALFGVESLLERLGWTAGHVG